MYYHLKKYSTSRLKSIVLLMGTLCNIILQPPPTSVEIQFMHEIAGLWLRKGLNMDNVNKAFQKYNKITKDLEADSDYCVDECSDQ